MGCLVIPREKPGRGERVTSFKLTNRSGLRLKVYYFDPAIENAIFWSGISLLDSSVLIGRLPMARRGEEVVKMKDSTLNALHCRLRLCFLLIMTFVMDQRRVCVQVPL